jgi:hypothetical protein
MLSAQRSGEAGDEPPGRRQLRWGVSSRPVSLSQPLIVSCIARAPTIGPSGSLHEAGTSAWTRGRRWLYFDEEWALSPSVARLTVTGRLFRRKRRSPAKIIYANPTPTMLQELQEKTPFSLALAIWPDCVLESTVRATAFDASGTPLQSDTAFPSDCF